MHYQDQCAKEGPRNTTDGEPFPQDRAVGRLGGNMAGQAMCCAPMPPLSPGAVTDCVRILNSGYPPSDTSQQLHRRIVCDLKALAALMAVEQTK